MCTTLTKVGSSIVDAERQRAFLERTASRRLTSAFHRQTFFPTE
jgi:hypothetical protein